MKTLPTTHELAVELLDHCTNVTYFDICPDGYNYVSFRNQENSSKYEFYYEHPEKPIKDINRTSHCSDIVCKINGIENFRIGKDDFWIAEYDFLYVNESPNGVLTIEFYDYDHELVDSITFW